MKEEWVAADKQHARAQESPGARRFARKARRIDVETEQCYHRFTTIGPEITKNKAKAGVQRFNVPPYEYFCIATSAKRLCSSAHESAKLRDIAPPLAE